LPVPASRYVIEHVREKMSCRRFGREGVPIDVA
jgi:hypothetical protein